LATGDVVYYAVATGTPAIAGITGGLWTGNVIQELPGAARAETIIAMPLTEAETTAALATARVTTTIRGTLAGMGIGLLVTGLIFFVFFAF
jgi:hypothetical protein